MLRWFLTYLSQAAWARKIVQKWGIAKRTAARFVAGETLDEAIAVVKGLNAKGISTTLDHLGEHVNSPEKASQAAQEIMVIIDRLQVEGVISGVSIKLSQIGLVIDQELCQENLHSIYQRARERGVFVRVDMEDSQLTQATLDLFKRVYSQGFEALGGIAIQAYLHRSENDLRDLLQDSIRVRLCKGAYKEPHTIAFPKKRDVDENFDKLADLLLEKSLALNSRVSSDGGIPPIPALATHDPDRINHALDYAGKIGLAKENLEFQMLHGIREDLQMDLVTRGYPVRVYVPYGQEWYPYFVRRLAERPANLWFFLSNLLRKKK
jgi:proline dehydrogenase